MPVERWHCNPLQIPMVHRSTPYLGFDNRIQWALVLVPKVIYSPEYIIKRVKIRRGYQEL